MKYLDWFDQNLPNYYCQYSLNDYDKEKYEAKVSSVDSRIKTFQELSKRVKYIGDQIHNYFLKTI